MKISFVLYCLYKTKLSTRRIKKINILNKFLIRYYVFTSDDSPIDINTIYRKNKNRRSGGGHSKC